MEHNLKNYLVLALFVLIVIYLINHVATLQKIVYGVSASSSTTTGGK